MEIWKSIPDFDKYEASSFGKIRNKETKYILTSKVNRSGYIRNDLTDNTGTKQSKNAHIFICLAFHGQAPNSTHTVDHINRIKTDNKPINLRWANKSEQIKNKTKTTRTCFLIEMINKDTKEITIFKDSKHASEIVKVHHQTIRKWIKTNKCYNNCYFNYQILKDLQNEQWKQIGKNFWVSTKGRIKDNKGRSYSSCIKTGYYVCSVNGKFEYVHRLVAKAFITNPNNYLFVNHKDNNGLNNNIENLEWCTHQQNMIHSAEYHKDKHQNINHYNSQKVFKIDTILKCVIKSYETIKDAAEDEGIHAASMSGRIRRKTCIDGYIFTKEKPIEKLVKITTKEKPVYKLDSELNIITIYSTIEEAAKTEQITPSTMRRITKTNTKIGEFIFSREEHPENIKEVEKIISKHVVQKINSKTNELLATYQSNLEASKQENISPNTLKYRILKGIIKENILFKYT